MSVCDVHGGLAPKVRHQKLVLRKPTATNELREHFDVLVTQNQVSGVVDSGSVADGSLSFWTPPQSAQGLARNHSDACESGE